MPEYQAVKEIFLTALDWSDPTERAAYLAGACGGDESLRARVLDLLSREDLADAFLASPLVEPSSGVQGFDAESERVGTRLGPYRLTRIVGEGGMGTVWLAEQQEPVRRQVAVKLIHADRESAQVVARFEAERQALALMNHPNIAQILDGGTTADGRPYLVMELITGTPITRYCDESRLTIRERLELFIPVCQAIQHAHQKGIIHRDIKPSNVLAADSDGRPVVKVIDFGVAKAADQRLTDTTLHTEFGTVVGTLEYMSPEQADLTNQDIDTRSDIYSLGVLLYELLTGSTPLTAERRRSASLLDALRAIREEEPPRPSARLSDPAVSASSISERRRTEPDRLRKLVRGELDWIVMKALEKERSRRYDTANGLARDIERYLDDQSVEACPPSAGYRARKFLRRYKWPAAAAGGILVTLVLGLIGTLNFAAGEARQRERAERNATLAEDKRIAAVHEAYRAQLAAAGAAIQNHDIAEAASLLEAAPIEPRDWEWRHLRGRLDDYSGRLRAEPGGVFVLFPRKTGIEVGQILPNDTFRFTDLEGRPTRTLRLGSKGSGIANPILSGGKLRILDWHLDRPVRLMDESVADRFQLSLRHVCDVSPDGSVFASPGPSGRPGYVGISFYETVGGTRTAVGVAHRTEIWSIAFSPDGRRAASADDSGLVCVWNVATGEKISECVGHASKVLSVAFRSDGARLVTASADSTVRQWDPTTGKQVEPPYDRHAGEVLAAAYSPDGEWVVSGGTDRTVRVWQATGRQDVALLHGHTGAVTQLAFTPDGKRLASLSRDRGLSWAPDNTVGVWDADFGSGFPVLRGHTSYVYPVAYSPDGRWIASGGWDRTVRLWDAATGELCAVLDCPGIVRTLAFCPDGPGLVTGDEEQEDKLRIWDIPLAKVRREIRQPIKATRYLAVSPKGDRIAATRLVPGKTLEWSVFDKETGEPLFSAVGACLSFSPNGLWIASRDESGNTLILRDARTYREIARLEGHTGLINSASFSLDGRLLATCGNDRTVRLWNLDTKQGRILRGHTDEVFTVAFHPQGTRLASAGRDGAVRLWDTARGEEVARLRGHTSYIWSLAFSPDGSSLVSGSGDGTVRLWDTAPPSARHQARREAEAIRPEAEQRIDRLFRDLKSAEAVVDQIRSDAALSDDQRHAAFRALLRRQAR